MQVARWAQNLSTVKISYMLSLSVVLNLTLRTCLQFLLPNSFYVLQGLFSRSIRGDEIGHLGLILENFDPVYGAYPLIYKAMILADLY